MVGLSSKELPIALTLYVALSFIFCKLFIALAKRNGRFAGRPEDLTAIQAAHDRIVPRVGGIPIFATVALAALVVADHLFHDYLRFVGAASLLFAAGLCEDLGLRVSPRLRLFAAASASLAAVLLLGVWLPRADVPLLDLAIQWWLFGVPLTVLLTSGVSHAFNMIDGVNGLAGLSATTTSLCIAAVSYFAGVPAIAELSLVVAAGVVGFLAWNFPHGKIFLGDAGAYTLGFVLSWFGISLLLSSEEVTPWAMLLAFFWPVADMLLAIRRRRLRKADAMAPDRMHFHQLVMRLLRSHILPQRLQARANALTTVVMAPFVIAPGLVGLALWNRPLEAFLACCLFFVLFLATYEVLLKHAPGMLKKTKRMYIETYYLPGRSGEVGPGE